MFKSFFIFYGVIHIVVGVLLFIFPSIFDYVLVESFSNGVAALLGFMSALAGLGFLGTAWVETNSLQRFIIRLAIIGNVLNGLAHIYNAMNGFSPIYIGFIGGIGVSCFILILLKIDRQLRHDAGW